MLQIGLSLSNRWTELDLVVGLVVLDLELEVVWIVGSKLCGSLWFQIWGSVH